MHRTIETEIWDDPKFFDKGLYTLLLANYLITCPESHVTGLYRFRLSVACEKTQMPADKFEEAFNKLIELGFCKYDSNRRVIWVINMWGRQPHNGIHLDRIPYHFKTLFETPLIDDWLDKYAEYNIEFPRVTAPTCHHPVTNPSPPEKGTGERNNPPTPLAGGARVSGKKTIRKTDPRIRIVKDTWDAFYPEFRYGNKYAWSSKGKDEKAIQKILKIGAPDPEEPLSDDHQMFKRMRLFLEDPFEDWKERAPRNKTLSMFASQWNRYDHLFSSANEKPKASQAKQSLTDDYFGKLCTEVQGLPEPERKDIIEKAKIILPKNIPKIIRPNSVAAQNMQTLCEIAIYCDLHRIERPESCRGVKG